MSTIKKYIISEWNDNKAVFAVDHSIATDELFHTINNFFSDHEDRLEECEGNVVIAVLKFIATFCFAYQANHRLSSYGIMSHFGTAANPSSGEEGFPRLDGSSGILLLSVDIPEFEIDEHVIISDLTEMPAKPEPF